MFWRKLKIIVEQKHYQRDKRFSIKYGQLYYKENRLFIGDSDCQVDKIHDIHEGSDNTSHNVSLSW